MKYADFVRWWRTARTRWHNVMPRFFKKVAIVCSAISASALAVNGGFLSVGAEVPEWWADIYPYLIAFPAGMAVLAKFTQAYDKNGNPISPEKEEKGNTVLDHDNF